MMLFEILPQQEEPLQADVMGKHTSVIRQSLKWPGAGVTTESTLLRVAPVPCAYFSHSLALHFPGAG